MLDLCLSNWQIWYEKVWAVVYLVPSDTKVLEIYLLKNIKNVMMSSYMTKLEFPPEPYMLFRLGKLSYTCFFLLHWVLLSFDDALWEVCLALKIKITYTPPTYTLLLPWGRRKDVPFHLDSPKNCSTPTLGVNTKNIPYTISPNEWSKFLLLSL
jgi:hypothetical protein